MERRKVCHTNMFIPVVYRMLSVQRLRLSALVSHIKMA